MRYKDLRCEALAWGELKETLGQFDTAQDKLLYIRKVTDILDEVARQAKEMLIVDVLTSEAFAGFFNEALTRWNKIRSVKGYVGAALKDMLN